MTANGSDWAADLPDMLTVRELAALFRISDKSVYSLVASRRIHHVKVLTRVRFLKTDVLKYMHENRVSALEKNQ